ncbi:xanthine dehydrogenase subunit D [Paenibacillus rhizovicinus]|uniref:Xanthine dehydrogenase subunit D n=1 Tax=Paenibacillus rhizovicinus TaxID=2704463 RepID=A0A6C0NTH2_9BACL|nr:xanthine dehydrogenase subunit D [Paenibacillus rhizovicinus]QHW29465.1 xanthine dehydrogenase subunit D [Paenibacillus rhizovicinus]
MRLNRQNSGTRWRVRPDGPEKVSGALTYLTDMTAPGMLYGTVLRSPHPHAAIRTIRKDAALRADGVAAVLTCHDVPGLNRFGIARQDQPVFCEERVRYVGDAVAAVAAETRELAELALALIEVEYELLPVLDDPERSLAPEAPALHPEGNVLHEAAFADGDIEAAFAGCAHIVEETYRTPRQMHAYMETEGGLFVPEPDGRLTVYAPTQHGLMDRLQLSRILALPEERIRVVSSPIGGSFGGKDELNVQPYGALLALATGRPVKIHNSRRESVRSGLKRHPMVLRMKTGIGQDGRIAAHQVRITADTGPYATLGAEVLNFATEHVIGTYAFGAVDVASRSVFTNNGMSGEFRGFGGNQAIFALEGQMDRLAEAAGLDPWTFRELNLKPAADGTGPFGQPIAKTDGAERVWAALRDSRLWRERAAGAAGVGNDAGQPPNSLKPWLLTGIGAAMVMHGAGLGFGIPDPSGGRLTFRKDGRIEAAFGFEECGQGLIATLEQMMVERLGLAGSDVRIVIGDTDAVPNSGSSTASRATTMMWKSLELLREPFADLVLAAAGQAAGAGPELLRLGEGGVRWRSTGDMAVAYADLAATLAEPIVCEAAVHYPTSGTERVGAHYLYSHAAVAVKVEINRLTGRVRVLDQYHVVAAGPVMNPQGYLGQIEGGSSMALGYALLEEAVMEGGQYVTKNLDTYLVPTIADQSGAVEVLPIEDLPEGDEHGPRGIGEIGSIGLAPAIASAVKHAAGRWINRLPIDPALLQEAFPIRRLEAMNDEG